MQISCPQIRQRGHCLASPGAARTAPLPHGCSSAHQWMPHVPSQALTCAAGGDAIHQQLLMRHSGLVGVAPWQQAGTWRRLGSRPLAGMQARTRGDGSICCCQGKALGRACLLHTAACCTQLQPPASQLLLGAAQKPPPPPPKGRAAPAKPPPAWAPAPPPPAPPPPKPGPPGPPPRMPPLHVAVENDQLNVMNASSALLAQDTHFGATNVATSAALEPQRVHRLVGSLPEEGAGGRLAVAPVLAGANTHDAGVDGGRHAAKGGGLMNCNETQGMACVKCASRWRPTRSSGSASKAISRRAGRNAICPLRHA